MTGRSSGWWRGLGRRGGEEKCISWLDFGSGENHSVAIEIHLKCYFQGKAMKKDLFDNINR